jgi:hypothetical protein
MSLSQLDWTQVIKSSYDDAAGALKTTPASGSVTEIAISHSGGDSIQVFAGHGSASGVAATGAVVGSVVISELAVTGFKEAQLYALSNAALGTPASASLQISPLASGGVWHTVASLQSSAASGGVVASSVQSFAAKRARVVLATAPVGGSADFHLVLNG